jgi:hypothetical protein
MEKKLNADTKISIAKKIIEWRKNAATFVTDCFNVEPTKQQYEILKAITNPGANVAVKSGHGVGKTAVAAWVAIWFIYLFNGVKSIATAPSSSQLRDVLMPEINKWKSNAILIVKELLDWHIMRLKRKDRPETQFLSARTSKKGGASSLQGFHSENGILIICDEFFGIEDEIFETLRGATTNENSRVLMLGNPTHITGYGYDIFHNRHVKDNWSLHTLSCLESPLVAKDYIESIERQYGKDSDYYKIRVLGEFPAFSITNLFNEEIIENAIGKSIPRMQYEFEPIVFGVDVSYFGSGKSVLVKRQGDVSEVLINKANIEITAFASQIIYYVQKYNPAAVFVDGIGVGAGVVSILKNTGWNVINVNFSHKSGTPGYFNKRAECYGLLKEWLVSSGSLQDEYGELIKNELMTIEYGYSNKNMDMQLLSKADMVKAGIKSHDIADAYALTFAYPVNRDSVNNKLRKSTKAKTYYNILERNLCVFQR